MIARLFPLSSSTTKIVIIIFGMPKNLYTMCILRGKRGEVGKKKNERKIAHFFIFNLTLCCHNNNDCNMRVYVCFDDDYDNDHHIGCFKTLLLYGAQCVNLFTFFSNEFF